MRVQPMGAQRFAPRLEPGMQVMGVVQRGQEIGALVRSADGQYMQVNGDIQQLLDSPQVESALRSAGIPQSDAVIAGFPGPRVTIKRRRIPELP